MESGDFDFRIEDFCNKDNSETDNKHLKRGKNRIKYTVDNELKFITIINNEDKLVLIK